MLVELIDKSKGEATDRFRDFLRATPQRRSGECRYLGPVLNSVFLFVLCLGLDGDSYTPTGDVFSLKYSRIVSGSSIGINTSFSEALIFKKVFVGYITFSSKEKMFPKSPLALF